MDSVQEPGNTPNGRPDRSGLLYFILGAFLALIVWGSQLIGIAVNVWLGGFVLLIAFALVVYAFWIWERAGSWHVLLRIGTIVLAAGIYSWFVGRQMVAEWDREHPTVAIKSPPQPVSPLPSPPSSPSAKSDESKKSDQRQSGKDNNQTGPITTGPCSSVQVGGSQNQSDINCGPPSLKLTWSVSEKPSQDSKHPFYREIAVIPNVEWHPIALVIKCNADIQVIAPYGNPLVLPDGYVSAQDSKTGYVTAEGPSVAAGQNFIVGIFADEPITVESVAISTVPRRRNVAEGPP